MPEAERRHRDRARLGRDPGRHLPQPGRRRPARQQDRLGRPADPPADRDRRPEPERAVARPRTRRRRSRSSRRACSSGRSRSRRPSSGRSRASTSRPAGATRSGATSSTPTRWSRTSGPATRRATRRPSSTATSTRSCWPSSSGWRPDGEAGGPDGLVVPPGPGERPAPDPARRRSSGSSFRPARPDELPDCGRIWRDSINDYLRRSARPRSPTSSARSGGSTPTPGRPIPERFVVATRPAPDGRTRIVGLRRRRSSAARSGSCRCCSSDRRRRARGSAERSSSGSCPSPTIDGVTGDGRRQPPADLDGALRPVRDRAADAGPRPARRDPAAGGLPRPARRASSRSRSRRSRPGRPAGPGHRELAADRRTRSTASCSGPSIRRTIASCGPRAGRASCIAARTAPPSATAMPARSAGSGRSPSATPTLLEAVVGHLVGGGAGSRRAGDLGARRRAPPGPDAPRGRPADRRVPAAAVLGPPVRGLRALPADLARACSDRPTACRRRPSAGGPARPERGSLAPDVAPLVRACGRSRDASDRRSRRRSGSPPRSRS